MTDTEFEQFLHQMSREKLDKWLRIKGLPFDSFANALAGESIANLAPPFDEYVNYTGSLIDFYKDFFQRYLQCLENIDSNTWEFVNISMRSFIKHNGGHWSILIWLKNVKCSWIQCKYSVNAVLCA